MCLIIRSEKEKEISREVMENMYARNDDGYGFMWIQDNKIHAIKRQGGSLDELYEKYKELKEFNPYIHLRMRTHGEINEENAHPYFCGYGIWLMHNGVIHHSSIDSNNKKSDTWQFIDNVLNPLFKASKNPHVLIRSSMFKILTEQFLGGGNRIVIGDRGGFILMHEKSWYTVPDYVPGIGGILVSNSYAWSPDKYKWAEKKSDSHDNTNRRRSTSSSSSTTSYPVTYLSHNGSLEGVVGKYWTDAFGGLWAYNGYGYLRRKDLDEYNNEQLIKLWQKYKGEIPYNPTLDDDSESALIILPEAKSGEAAANDPKIDISSGEDVTPKFPNSTGSILLLPNNMEKEESKGEEEEEHPSSLDDDDLDHITEAMYTELDTDFLCKEWAKYPDEDIETLFWTDPEEAQRVLKHALRRFA